VCNNASTVLYINIGSITGCSGLELSSPAHLVDLSTALVVFKLSEISIHYQLSSVHKNIGIHDFNCIVTKSTLCQSTINESPVYYQLQ